MNVLFVDQLSEVGGAQQCFLQLLPAILEAGGRVHAMLPGNGPLTQVAPMTPIPCGPYETGAKSFKDMLHFTADCREQARAITRMLDSERFDLVYVNGPRVLTSAVIAARTRAPILFHAHNYLDTFYARRIAQWTIRSGVRTVVACSKFVAGALGATRTVRIVPNGSCDMGFRDRAFRPPFRIGVIGRIEPQKGQIDAIRAAAQIKNANLSIYGAPPPGEHEYFEKCKQAARGPNVQFSGYRAEPATIYPELDVIIIPSVQEGFSLVMLEAMSAGAVVIAYGRGAMQEVITSGEVGYLVPECSPAGIVRALSQVTPARLQSIAQSARRLWEEGHTITDYRRRMLAAMRETAFGTATLP